MFGKYGKVVDVYIAFKKTKRNTRFGFVRFIHIGDMDSFERRLKSILIGNERLVINRAKFTKGDNRGTRHSNFPPLSTGVTSRHRPPKQPGYSFKESVVGLNKPHPPQPISIAIKEDKSISSKDAAAQSLEENGVWLQQWFENIKMWDDDSLCVGHLTWLVIGVLPTLGRHIVSIKSISKLFGKTLEIGRMDFDSHILRPTKCLILTSSVNEDSMFEEEFVETTRVDRDGAASSECSSPRREEDDKAMSVHSPFFMHGVANSGTMGNEKELNEETIPDS
ncbi:nucleotide-binding alpha-beta plait domain-containing protein [Tanacetum coccineum]